MGKEKQAAEKEKAGTEQERRIKKVREGIVVSNSMEKTAVVAIKRLVKHGQYGKFVRRTRKFYAHDGSNSCQVGDIVRIVETRPLSKSKRWRVQKVLVKAV